QLENYLGEDRFRDGIRRYMAAHAYGNATTADLWQALGDASGEPVAAIAASFTGQAGVPLIRAEARGEGGVQRVHLAQERFSIHDPHAAPRRWQIPVVLVQPGASETRRVLLADPAADIAAGSCGAAFKLNPDGIGYYRVQYDAA